MRLMMDSLDHHLVHLMIVAVGPSSPDEQLVEKLEHPESGHDLPEGLTQEAEHEWIQGARNGGQQLRGEHKVRVAGRQAGLCAKMPIDYAELKGGPANN